MKKLHSTVALLSLIMISGCADKEPPKYYYKELARRSNTLVKFSAVKLDLFRWELQVSLETAIDVSQADTARKIVLSEIAYPLHPKERCFSATVDLLDYQYMMNALKNFLRTGPKVDGPLFYTVDEGLRMIFRSDSGLVLEDSTQGSFFVRADSARQFMDFLGGLQTLAEKPDSIIPHPEMFAHLDSIIARQMREYKKKSRLQPIQTSGAVFRLGSRDIRNDRQQIDCSFQAYNPNPVPFKFHAQMTFEGRQGTAIHSFSSEEVKIPPHRRQTVSASTVVRGFEAERIEKIWVEVYEMKAEGKPQIISEK